jgi:hypothetical protein
LRLAVPHGHRKTTTLVAGLRNTGTVAPLVVDGSINGAWFEAYVGQVLVPTLKPGDVVILDNLSSHKRPAAEALIEAAGLDIATDQTTCHFGLRQHDPLAFKRKRQLIRQSAARAYKGCPSTDPVPDSSAGAGRPVEQE